MDEKWHLADTATAVDEATVEALLDERLGSDMRTTVLESDLGRILMIVTNGERAMVMLLDEPGDSGGHAVDAGATGASGGFVLDNGQIDEYPNRDTVPWAHAKAVVRRIVATGERPDSGWQVD